MTPTPERALIELLEAAVSAGVRLDSDGRSLFVVGVAPHALAARIHARRADLIHMLSAQRRLGEEVWGGPRTSAAKLLSTGEMHHG